MPLCLDDLETFGTRVKQILAAAGLTQQTFSERLKSSQPYISDVIKKGKKPGLEFLYRLGMEFDVDMNWLILNKKKSDNGYVDSQFLSAIALRIKLAKLAAEGETAAIDTIDMLKTKGSVSHESLTEAQQQLFVNLATQEKEIQLLSALYNRFVDNKRNTHSLREALDAALEHYQSDDDSLLSLVKKPHLAKDAENSNYSQERFMSVCYLLEVAGSEQSDHSQSIMLMLLETLQNSKQLEDKQVANLLGLSLLELQAVKRGQTTLPFHAKFKVLDSMGYVVVRDLLLNLLPKELATRLKILDIFYGQKNTTKNI